MKNILVLCTGNSCRSIIAEALINQELGERFKAFSSGVEASGQVNPGALAALERATIPTQGLNSKKLETVINLDFDLVITVCNHAKETCPVFPKKVPKIHCGIIDAQEDSPTQYDRILRDTLEIVLPALVDFFEQD